MFILDRNVLLSYTTIVLYLTAFTRFVLLPSWELTGYSTLPWAINYGHMPTEVWFIIFIKKTLECASHISLERGFFVHQAFKLWAASYLLVSLFRIVLLKDLSQLLSPWRVLLFSSSYWSVAWEDWDTSWSQRKEAMVKKSIFGLKPKMFAQWAWVGTRRWNLELNAKAEACPTGANSLASHQPVVLSETIQRFTGTRLLQNLESSRMLANPHKCWRPPCARRLPQRLSWSK